MSSNMCKSAAVVLLLASSLVAGNGATEDNEAGDTKVISGTPNGGAGEPITVAGIGATEESRPNHEAGDAKVISGTPSGGGGEPITVAEPPNGKKEEEKVEASEEDVLEQDSEESKTLKGEIKDDTINTGQISLKCRDCLCHMATGCSLDRQCELPESTDGLGPGFEKGDCGPFHISFPFWADAHNIVLTLDDAKLENDWRLCALDLLCASDTMQKYFDKYHRDCNGDKSVDCIDYAAIHTLGPYGCLKPKNLNRWNHRRRKDLLRCMVSSEGYGVYAKEMMRLEEKARLQDIGARREGQKQEKHETEDAVDGNNGPK